MIFSTLGHTRAVTSGPSAPLTSARTVTVGILSRRHTMLLSLPTSMRATCDSATNRPSRT